MDLARSAEVSLKSRVLSSSERSYLYLCALSQPGAHVAHWSPMGESLNTVPVNRQIGNLNTLTL